MRSIVKYFSTGLFVLGLLAMPLQAGAHTIAGEPPGFRPSLLISDSAFTNTYAMDGNAVQGFLQSKGSWLANYTIPEYVNVPYFCRDGVGNPTTQYVSAHQVRDVTGGGTAVAYGMRAADLIAERARANGINPQVMLVLIQRESSGITSSSPTSDLTRAWPIFYNFDETMASYGYSCATARSIAENFGGAGLQFSYGAYNLRNKYNQANTWNSPITIDGVTFTPESRATKVLYVYTPHIHNGNHNFWYLFSIWFGGTPPPAYSPPLVRNNGLVYVADAGKLWHIADADTFTAWGFNWGLVTDLSGSPYAAYPVAGDLTKLVRTSWGRVFMIERAKKRPIMSARIFNKFGLNWGKVVPFDDALLDKIPTGIPLWELTRVQGTGAVYLQSRGQNHAVPNPQTFLDMWGFSWGEVADVPSYVVMQFPVTEELSQLAKSNDGRIFYIDSGVKYYVPNPDIFNRYGFSWADVVAIESSFLDNFPTRGNLTTLIGAPDGRVFYVENGVKRYVSGAAFSSHKFSFADVHRLSWSSLNGIPNGANL